MRIHKLKIHNFRVIKDADLTFDDKVICIIGKNGHGKSSLIEAIAWALYGNQASRTSKDEIKSTFADRADSCEVSVTFSINNESYRVVRRLSGKSDKAEVELYRGDSSESVGVNETKNYVGNLLGLDWKGFLSSFLARQSELSALSDLPPSKRKDHISGMLGIEKLDKAIIKIKGENSALSKQISYLNNMLSQKSTVEEIIVDLQKKFAVLNAEIDRKTKIYADTKSRFELVKSGYEKLSEKRVDYTRLTADLASQKRSIVQLQEHLQKQKSEITEIEAIKTALVEAESKFSTLGDIPEKVRKYEEVKHKQNLLSSFKQQLASLSEKQKSDTGKAEDSGKKADILKNELSQFPKDLEKLVVSLGNSLDGKRGEYQKLNAEINVSRQQQEKIKQQYANIDRLKADSICESCKRPLGEHHTNLKVHLKEEIDLLEKELEKQSAHLLVLKNEGSKLKDEKEAAELKLKEFHEKTRQYENSQKEHDTFIKSLAERAVEIETLQRKIEEAGDVVFDAIEYSNLLAKQKEYDLLKMDISRKQTTVERLPELAKEVTATEAKLTVSTNEQESLEKQLGLLGFSEEQFQKSAEEFIHVQKEYEQINSEYQNILSEKKLVENDIKRNQERIETFAENEKESERLKDDHYHLEKLVSLMTEYRQQLIASIRPTLADRSSRLFNEMTDNKYNMVELDDKYELRVMDNGEYYGIERFSGGEKDLANLCLRLAISISLTESAGMDSSFIILDEVFGSQDEERKELIVKSLTKLKHRFPQIILITHIDSIKDGVEQIIEVVRNEQGYSEVLVEET